MILAGEKRAFVNFFVEAAELRFDVSAHGDEFFVLRRHLLDLLPRVTQLLRTARRRISLLHVADLTHRFEPFYRRFSRARKSHGPPDLAAHQSSHQNVDNSLIVDL